MAIDSNLITLKASFYTITLLQLNQYNAVEFESKLEAWIKKAPQFLKGMPVIIDLSSQTLQHSDVAPIISSLRQYGLVPVGIQGGNAKQQDVAHQLNLALFSKKRQNISPSNQQDPEPKDSRIVSSPKSSPTLVESVRSGQHLHAQGDLVILQSVNCGGEVSAEGNIHVYGTLAGRALAGTAGNKHASIFCSKLEAELVAIAGCYWQYDDLKKTINKNNIQIYLADESLHIRLLG